MAHSYDDEVHVRTGPGGVGAGGGAGPTAFLWRDRLHVVRAVQSHWHERRAWWEHGDRRVLATGSAGGPAGGPAGAAGSGGEGGSALALAGSDGALAREVWRVEASTGRTAGGGVYELCRESPGLTDVWSLRRVDD